MENVLKIIEGIGNQWPLFLEIFIFIIFILKWKTIWAFIASITQIRVKHGRNEFEINKKGNKDERNRHYFNRQGSKAR